jgi:hypothetical protein
MAHVLERKLIGLDQKNIAKKRVFNLENQESS